MNTRKWIIASGTVILAALLVLVMAAGLSRAQGPGPERDINEASRNEAATASVYNVIPIQGRLTDQSGAPIDGARIITFSLYSSSYVTTPVCQDDDSVNIDNGLFSAEMDYCTSSDIDGKRLYLGIQVEGDDEMVNRQAIYPVPYAFSLRPGAIISGSTSVAILHVENYHSSGRGIRAYAMSETGTNYAVVGGARSSDGYGGYFYNSGGGIGLLGKTDVVTNFGVVGFQTGYSLSDYDTGAYWESAGLFGGRNGVVGLTNEGSGWGVFGLHNASSGSGAAVKGATLSPDGWSASFTTGAGNGVYISAPGGKSGLNVASGTKSAVVSTSDGSRLLYTEESTQVWFTDYGFGKLDDGTATIPINPVFAQTVNLEDEPYHVFVQVYGDAEVYVSNRTSTQFEVSLRDGDPNTEFSYRIVGKRLGYEEHRMERAPWADNDPNLSP
ncbi:MAG: hypothetical protein SXV54_22545 [Chloroflexota bacterium]|nr:hypothetical protein [Chloroflexota bacterium]